MSTTIWPFQLIPSSSTGAASRPHRPGARRHPSYPQPCLVHQGQDRLAEELDIRREVEERDLYPIAAGPLEPDQLVDHVFRAADDLDVAAQRSVLVAVRLPG